MTEEKAAPRKRQGVRGWRAFFWCSDVETTAALLVVGTFVGAVRMLGSAVTQDSESPGGGVAEGSWEPPSAMPADALKLCRHIERSPETAAFTSMFPERIDDDDDYKDPGPGANPRLVFDDCEWSLQSPENGEWRFVLSYYAWASQDSNEVRTGRAEDRFSGLSSKSQQRLSEVSGSGEVGGIVNKSRFWYGSPQGRGTRVTYFLGRLVVVSCKLKCQVFRKRFLPWNSKHWLRGFLQRWWTY